jgi:diadenosine tetraphosphate (Ap4A) HIT family hydrolase
VTETPEELFRRAQAAVGSDGRLPMPPVVEWQTFPFDGDLRVRELVPAVAEEPPRTGEDEADCWRCGAGDADAIWSNRNWTVTAPPRPTGLPVVVFLNSRAHLDLDDVTGELAADMGRTLVRVHHAVARVPHVERVHVCRWGDGSFHLHWWLLGRPERLPQIRGTFAAIWDDILPPTPEEVWRANLDTVAGALADDGTQPQGSAGGVLDDVADSEA